MIKNDIQNNIHLIDVSIIYVNYKTGKLIQNSINSIKLHTNNIQYEIIVVNNGSEDDALKSLITEFPEVILISSNQNIGFGRANNLGIEKAKGKYLFFLNPDTLLLNNAINILHDFMEQNASAGACGGNLYTTDQSPTYSFSRKPPSLSDDILEIFYLPSTFSPSAYFNFTNKPMEVASIVGADFMVRSSLIKKLGGFDPRFFLNYEETDLCRRILYESDYKIISVPDARIIHLEGKSEYINESHQFFVYQGKYIYFDKVKGKSQANLLYKIIRFKSNLRILVFYILNNKKKIHYWKTKREMNQKAYLSYKSNS